jgi:hypothetical protein
MNFWKTSMFALTALLATTPALAACGGGGNGGRGAAAPTTELRQGHTDGREQVREPKKEEAKWEKLGERVVDGKVDKDTIAVGRDDGRFSEIQIRVEGSALEMFNVVVTFGDGESFSPPTRLVFGKGTNSRAIDLPGGKRVIKKVEFKYGNLPGGGRARVELWAR